MLDQLLKQSGKCRLAGEGDQPAQRLPCVHLLAQHVQEQQVRQPFQ